MRSKPLNWRLIKVISCRKSKISTNLKCIYPSGKREKTD